MEPQWARPPPGDSECYGCNVQRGIRKVVDPRAQVITDDCTSYRGIGGDFAGGHWIIRHSDGEYAYWDVNTTTVESSCALLKRSIYRVYHNVGREYLHRHLWQFDFL